jgi:hypothetical protein
MQSEANNRPDDPATQSAVEPIEDAPIEEIIMSCLVTAPLGGSLELGSDGQYSYHPKRHYPCVPAADVFEFVALD